MKRRLLLHFLPFIAFWWNSLTSTLTFKWRNLLPFFTPMLASICTILHNVGYIPGIKRLLYWILSGQHRNTTTATTTTTTPPNAPAPATTSWVRLEVSWCRNVHWSAVLSNCGVWVNRYIIALRLHAIS